MPDASGITTWTALGDDINLPPSGPSSGTINIPLSASTRTAFFESNAKGNVLYNMSVTIDATLGAVSGQGFRLSGRAVIPELNWGLGRRGDLDPSHPLVTQSETCFSGGSPWFPESAL
ncbi:MAG TPA: hypothetical protein VGK58_24610 [Lacipirellulaceae bacterium]